LALAESAAADAQAKAGQIERDSVASAKSAKDWAGKFGALQNEHLALREEVKRASAGDGDLKAVVDSLRKRAKDAEERLALTMRQKAESAAKAEAEVTGLRGQIAELENAKLAEAARTSDEAGALREELSHHEITIRVQQSRISELEAGLAKMESA
jgi:predicted oxidoreductase